MNKKDLHELVKTQYHQLNRLRQGFNDNHYVEKIHKFRLGYKKLRAILVGIATSEMCLVDVPDFFKKLYKLSGKIRDIQLFQQQIQQSGENNSKLDKKLINLTRNEIAVRKTIFFEIFSKRIIRRSEKESLKALPEAFQLDDYFSFVSGKWAFIQPLLHSNCFSDDKLHLLRRELKNLNYIEMVFDHDEKDCSEAIKPWKSPAVTLLSDRLGNYQDQCTAIKILKKMSLHNDLANNERMELACKQKIFSDKKTLMKKSLLDDIRAVRKVSEQLLYH